MSGNALSAWWNMARCYVKTYPELWVGIGLMGISYYKLSYGGKKAVKDKSSGHGH